MTDHADLARLFRFVLVRTSHPGNIGSAARAIRTMGFTRLDLVAPAEFPSREADALAALYAQNSTFEDIPLAAFPKDHEEMKKLWLDTWASLADFRMEPDAIVADDTGGAASFTMSGRHTGDFPGYPASGKSFSLKGASIIRIIDGKITAWTDYWSSGDLERQLGGD